MSSVVISSGHGKHVAGASGPSPWGLVEVTEARRVVNRSAEILKGMGVTTIVYHDDISDDQDENLKRICDNHNNKGPHDLDVSVHFNSATFSGSNQTSNPVGCEVFYESSAGKTKAKAVVDAICKASGLINRGPKDGNLYFLNHTAEVAILIEVCFVNSKADVNIYNAKFEQICTAIAESISGQTIGEPVEPPPEEVETTLPPAFDQATIDEIRDIAASSPIADYSWKDRGRAPDGYTQGMALAYGMALRRFLAGDSFALEAAKADTHDDDTDALSWYRSNFQALGMHNDADGIITLRHLYVLLLGLGMRESSGKHCEGVDQSADNHESETAECGLHQTSYNIHTCSPEIDKLFEQYGGCLEDELSQCYLDVFEDGVSCSTASWKCYGSGDGLKYQEMSKNCPPFHVEVTAIGLRKRRQHWGPINRKEAELRADADIMFKAIEDIVMELDGETPAPVEEATVNITTTGPVRITINGQVIAIDAT